MKNLYIGDIHGNVYTMGRVNRYFPDHHKIFVGDFLDSFHFTRAEQLACIELALKMIDEGNTECLFGNHELSYLFPKHFKASGYAGTMDSLLVAYKSKMFKQFKPFIYDKENRILVTHAGLTMQLFERFKLNFDTLDEILLEWYRFNVFNFWDENNEYSPFYWIGNNRGGHNPIGGPMWCDWNAEFVPIYGLTQIFGHTAYLDIHRDLTEGIRKDGSNYNLDCLDRKEELLEFDTETKKFQYLQLPDEVNHQTTLV